MRYIENLFEKFILKQKPFVVDRDYIMGRLLNLYGNIPVPKKKAQDTINRILISNWQNGIKPYSPYYTIGKDVDLSHYNTDRDKVRFVDYFESLLDNKEIRGHNFEGFIAAIYDGILSEQMFSRYDVIIKDKTWSVKFNNDSNESPELGSFKNDIKIVDSGYTDKLIKQLKTTDEDLITIIKNNNGLSNFRNFNKNLKNLVWKKVISKDITGGWMIAYPEKDKKSDEHYSKIIVNIINLDAMKKLLEQGLINSPRAGLTDLFSIRLSPKYKKLPDVKNFTITIPKLSFDELKKIYFSDDEKKWAEQIFGKLGKKIRPEILRYIKSHRDEISTNLKNFENFKNL